MNAILISIGNLSVQALCLRGKHQRIRCLCLQFLWLGRPNGFIVFLTRHLVCLSDADSSVLPCTLSCPNVHRNFQSSWYLAGRNVQLHLYMYKRGFSWLVCPSLYSEMSICPYVPGSRSYSEMSICPYVPGSCSYSEMSICPYVPGSRS